MNHCWYSAVARSLQIPRYSKWEELGRSLQQSCCQQHSAVQTQTPPSRSTWSMAPRRSGDGCSKQHGRWMSPAHAQEEDHQHLSSSSNHHHLLTALPFSEHWIIRLLYLFDCITDIIITYSLRSIVITKPRGSMTRGSMTRGSMTRGSMTR